MRMCSCLVRRPMATWKARWERREPSTAIIILEGTGVVGEEDMFFDCVWSERLTELAAKVAGAGQAGSKDGC